jgi:hypothetical protein
MVSWWMRSAAFQKALTASSRTPSRSFSRASCAHSAKPKFGDHVTVAPVACRPWSQRAGFLTNSWGLRNTRGTPLVKHVRKLFTSPMS